MNLQGEAVFFLTTLGEAVHVRLCSLSYVTPWRYLRSTYMHIPWETSGTTYMYAYRVIRNHNWYTDYPTMITASNNF